MLAGRWVDFSHRTCRGQEPPNKEPPKIDKVNNVIHEKLLARTLTFKPGASSCDSVKAICFGMQVLRLEVQLIVEYPNPCILLTNS